jgi:hypothetical protein
MVEQEMVIDIFVHNRRKIYCSINMFPLGSLDETNLAGYTSEV